MRMTLVTVKNRRKTEFMLPWKWDAGQIKEVRGWVQVKWVGGSGAFPSRPVSLRCFVC